jgi:hypothetical protein
MMDRPIADEKRFLIMWSVQSDGIENEWMEEHTMTRLDVAEMLCENNNYFVMMAPAGRGPRVVKTIWRERFVSCLKFFIPLIFSAEEQVAYSASTQHTRPKDKNCRQFQDRSDRTPNLSTIP